MRRFIQSKLALIVGAALFAGYFAVGALAAPGATPWPDPLESSAAPVANEEHEPEETEEPEETPEADETPELDEEDATATPGVPLDSPACAGTIEDPNPHDPDGDGDG